MVSFSDIKEFLTNIQLWARLKTLPDEVDDLQTRLKQIEDQQLSKNRAILCRTCQRGPVDVDVIETDPRIVYKLCPFCGDEWITYPDKARITRAARQAKTKFNPFDY